MKLLKKEDVITPGWYIGLSFIDKEPEETDIPWYFANGGFLYEFDDDGIWRSISGHGITIEDPSYFDEFDRFLGPIDFNLSL